VRTSKQTNGKLRHHNNASNSNSNKFTECHHQQSDMPHHRTTRCTRKQKCVSRSLVFITYTRGETRCTLASTWHFFSSSTTAPLPSWTNSEVW